MSRYASTSDLSSIAARLRSAAHITIVTHAKPDGDAAGSVLALARALRAIGKSVDAFFTGVVEANIMALALPGEVLVAPAAMPSATTDLVVLVDTGAWSQVEPLHDFLRAMAGRVIGLDHHARGDEIASDRIVDPSLASATQLVVKLVDELGVPLVCPGASANFSIAEAVFTGLATDTGWFRFQSADAAVYALAARLLALGVDKIALYQRLEENWPATRLGMMARALSSLTFHQDGRVAMMCISLNDINAAGASSTDLAGFVNIPLAIGSIGMSIVLTEAESNLTRASFRSKPSLSKLPPIDVNAFAARFGGGGHVQAAGAKFRLPLDQARLEVERELLTLCSAPQ
ncbi:MAG: hypothetical protein EXS17_04205 [Phycisphaerales bacterium]|nr:hypothetical protein [Phycisphaerales bacterium]